MIKNLFLLLLLTFSAATAFAQHAPGSWKVFPMSGEYFTKVLDTPRKVFYVTGGCLYSYDKEYEETVFYAPGQRINDYGISDIFFNPDKNYLAVVYENSNIDLIYDDGSVVSLPEIKNSSITTSTKVNNLFFANDRIYVATDFGIVVFSDKDHIVVESGILGARLQVLWADDNYLYTVVDYKLMCSPLAERHNSLSKFTSLTNMSADAVYATSDNSFIYTSGSGNSAGIYKLKINAPQSASYSKTADVPGLVSLRPYKNGFVAYCGTRLVFLNPEGTVDSTIAIPELLKDNTLSTWEGQASVWAADHFGPARFDISGNSPVMLSERFRPESFVDFASGYATNSPDNSSVYITSIGMSEYHPAGDPSNERRLPFFCEKYDWATGRITTVHPYGVKNLTSLPQWEANQINSKYFYGGAGNTIVDPVDPTLIYHCNNFEGLFLMRDQQIVHCLDKNDFPANITWESRLSCIEFDQMGNLWFGTWALDNNCFFILPKDKVDVLRKNPEAIQKSDFVVFDKITGESGKMDMRLLALKNSNKLLYIRGSWGGPIIGFDTKGTPSFTDDTAVVYSDGFLDDDGVITNPQSKTCLVEDLNGQVWFGSSNGVFILRDKNQIGVDNGSRTINVIRPKVARNDGTNYADYLLASETVLYIAVDPSNRKWIATQASGLYLVSEDGSEILEHITADNSPLMSNTVYTVACDPSSNDVLIGTPYGMYLYSSTSAPAADDYSEVYAFPNPVRPDYGGWITINGLMDNSLVKIADAQGSVLWEGRSEGGMVVWDGCNRDGSRVRSGVYMVLASQNADGSFSGVVTKIVVIN